MGSAGRPPPFPFEWEDECRLDERPFARAEPEAEALAEACADAWAEPFVDMLTFVLTLVVIRTTADVLTFTCAVARWFSARPGRTHRTPASAATQTMGRTGRDRIRISFVVGDRIIGRAAVAADLV